MKKLMGILQTLCMLPTCASALAATPAGLVGDWYLQYQKTGVLSDAAYRRVENGVAVYLIRANAAGEEDSAE